jgi:hypothetical protein
VSLGSVLAFLELERRTGLLRIGPHTNGRVYVLDGRPVATELDGAKAPASSVDRFHQLLDVRSGRFDFVAGPVSREDEIKASTTNLLLEHARRSDETSR